MDLKDVLEAGQNLGLPRVIAGGGTFAVVPEGSDIRDLESYLGSPIRARANVTAHETDAFIQYFNKFKNADSAIFGDQINTSVWGIIDYHSKDKPAFREHKLSYVAPLSIEWKTWLGDNKKPVAQSSFAQFIEDNLVNVRSPAAADMLEISRSLQANKSVVFSSSTRLQDGTSQFTYSETIDGATARGTIKVPDDFTLGIPVFRGGVLYEVRARLRYRINDGKLLMWYDLYRPDLIIQDAFKEVLAKIGAGTGTEIWLGAP